MNTWENNKPDIFADIERARKSIRENKTLTLPVFGYKERIYDLKNKIDAEDWNREISLLISKMT